MKCTNKIIILLVYIIISVFILIFVNNNSFLYKDTIMKITNIKVIEIDVYYNPLGIKEKHYNDLITGIILNGPQKGETVSIEYERTSSSVVTEKYLINNKVFIKDNTIEGFKRDTFVIGIILVFIGVIIIVGKVKGFLTIITIIINFIIFNFILNHFYKKFLILGTIVTIILSTIITLIITNGYNKKSISSIISTIISISIIGMLILIIKIFGLFEINYNGMSFLTISPEEIFIAELLIGGLGAIMDVSITMSSSFYELIVKNDNITQQNLVKSGYEIGKDIMSTMINVLFFTYLSSGLPLFVLAIRNGVTLHNYVASNYTLELIRFLIGGLGIIIAIPISIYVSSYIYKEVNNG